MIAHHPMDNIPARSAFAKAAPVLRVDDVGWLYFCEVRVLLKKRDFCCYSLNVDAALFCAHDPTLHDDGAVAVVEHLSCVDRPLFDEHLRYLPYAPVYSAAAE